MYHNNNYGGYHNRGSGFRNNYNNYNNNGPRINELQVPQSKHTVFIRGLHGDVTTEEIKEYIGEKVGKISFDFVKVAQDRSKIFVAVRFEKREEAKEFMEAYSNREFMGCRCDLSWFRDIRRFCAYQRSKQVRSNSQRRRRRSDSEESSTKRSSSPPVRRGGRSKSRSDRSRSPSRSRSRSRSASRSLTRSKSPAPKKERPSRIRTRSRTRSRHSNRSRSATRSRSCSSNKSKEFHRSDRSRSVSVRRSDDGEYHDESFNKKDRVRDNENKHQKRRRDGSDAEYSDHEEIKDKNKKKSKKEEQLPQIPLPPKGTLKSTPKPSPLAAPPTPKSESSPVFIPPPTAVDMELESPPQHVSSNSFLNYQQQNQYNNYQIKKEPSPITVSYSVPMEEEATPKMIVRDVKPQTPISAYYPASIQQQTNQLPQPVPAATISQSPQLPPTTPTSQSQPAFVPRQVGRIEIVMPATLPAPVVPAVPAVAPMASIVPVVNGSSSSVESKTLDIALFPTTNKLFGHLNAFQSALLSTVKYEKPVKKEEEDDESLSSLRLSSFATDESSEEQKAMEREQKLAKLSDEQMMRFHIKKKQFEAAFRNDCETYAVVTRALLAKDESLLFGLKMALLENMEDLHKKMMQRVDDYLDALLVMA